MRFIDVQVNGYAGEDFHHPMDETQLRHAADTLIKDGVAACLPTVVTNEVDYMVSLLGNLRRMIDADPEIRRLMPAFHIEGPCLSPVEGYRGAHNPEYIQPASRDVIEPLIDAAGGPERVAIVTLAPEQDPGLRTSRWLGEMGIIVAAGHTDCPLEILREFEHVGTTMFTHLGNGSAAMMNRHDNIIHRALSLDRMIYSIIPDGVHVPVWLVTQWIKIVGFDRCLFTTDCMPAASCGPGRYPNPSGIVIEVGDDLVARFPGTPYLAGAAITMQDGYNNAIHHMGLTESQATQLCCDNPRKLIQKFL